MAFAASCLWRQPKKKEPRPQKHYRNPIYLAWEWKRALDSGAHRLPADLARFLKMSRARVTQVLRLLKLAPETQQLIQNLGDPLTSRLITERQLRPIIDLPQEAQGRAVEAILSGAI